MIYTHTLNPNNTEKTPDGLLASLFRKLLHEPIIKGKKVNSIHSLPNKLQHINQLKDKFKRHNTKIPDVSTVTRWLYSNSLTHKSFFTLLTLLLKVNRIDLSIVIHHDKRMVSILGCSSITTHTVSYVDNDDVLLIKDKDNITYLLKRISDDLKLDVHMDGITDMLNKYLEDTDGYNTGAERSNYKSKLKRTLITPNVSWESFIAFIELLLFTSRYDLHCNLYYEKTKLNINTTLEVGK